MTNGSGPHHEAETAREEASLPSNKDQIDEKPAGRKEISGECPESRR